MTIWIAIFLFLHVMGAIIAFGPVFSASRSSAQMAGKEPQHAQLRRARQRSDQQDAGHAAGDLPGDHRPGSDLPDRHQSADPALARPRDRPLRDRARVRDGRPGRRPVKRIVELTSTPPPPGASGPPPELMAAVKSAQRGGIFLGSWSS